MGALAKDIANGWLKLWQCERLGVAPTEREGAGHHGKAQCVLRHFVPEFLFLLYHLSDSEFEAFLSSGEHLHAVVVDWFGLDGKRFTVGGSSYHFYLLYVKIMLNHNRCVLFQGKRTGELLGLGATLLSLVCTEALINLAKILRLVEQCLKVNLCIGVPCGLTCDGVTLFHFVYYRTLIPLVDSVVRYISGYEAQHRNFAERSLVAGSKILVVGPWSAKILYALPN